MTSENLYHWPLTPDAAPGVATWIRKQFARLDRVLTKDRSRLGVALDPTANTGEPDWVVYDPVFTKEFRLHLLLGWDALRKAIDWAAAAGLTDGLPLTPTDRLIEPENMTVDADRSLDALTRYKNSVLVFLDGLSQQRTAGREKYVLLSEVSKTFAMKPKAVKTFCEQHKIPTDKKPRRFWIALVPFVTAYAQATNVRTDTALRNRITTALNRHEIAEKLDAATSAFLR